jgi:hypothetical protein
MLMVLLNIPHNLAEQSGYFPQIATTQSVWTPKWQEVTDSSSDGISTLIKA